MANVADNLTTFIQLLSIGLLNGGLFAISASGLSLIYGVQRVLNLAHGDLLVLSAYFTWLFSITLTPLLKVSPLLAVVVNVAAMAAIGSVIYFLLIDRIQSLGFEPPLLATFGLAVFLQTTMGALWTGYPKIAQNQPYSTTSLAVGSILLPQSIVIGFIAGVIGTLSLHFFLVRTYFGLAIRASSQDWEAAEFTGVNVRRVRWASFALGVALAGVGGTFYSVTSSFVPVSGTSILLILLTIVVLGGTGSVLGTLFASIVVGIIQQIGAFYFGPEVGTIATFLAFLLVLLVRPTGLFGKQRG